MVLILSTGLILQVMTLRGRILHWLTVSILCSDQWWNADLLNKVSFHKCWCVIDCLEDYEALWLHTAEKYMYSVLLCFNKGLFISGLQLFISLPWIRSNGSRYAIIVYFYCQTRWMFSTNNAVFCTSVYLWSCHLRVFNTKKEYLNGDDTSIFAGHEARNRQITMKSTRAGVAGI